MNDGDTEVQTPAGDGDTQFSSARLIEIDPPEGSPGQTGTDQEQDSTVVIQGPSTQPAPVEQTVHADGSVTFHFGDRFMRPLMAHIGCDGDISQSHAGNPDSDASSCTEEDSQGEREQ